MNKIFLPIVPEFSLNFELSEHISEMEKGYASQIVGNKDLPENATPLFFQNVDDHVDGNGLAVLWLIKGQGTFYHEEKATQMNAGDIIVFDDRKEHGFESNEICCGINFLINPSYSHEQIIKDVEKINQLMSKKITSLKMK